MLRIGTHLAARYDGIRAGTNSTFTVLVEMSQTEVIAVVLKRFVARRYSTSWIPECKSICHDRLDKSVG